MKKTFAILMALLMVLSLAACGKTNAAQPSTEATEAPTTPAQILLVDFKDRVNSGEQNPEALVNALLENPCIPFAGASMPVEPGFLNGFTGEITGFAQGMTFGPMIGAIPFVGYIFQLEDGVDANAFMDTLKQNADLRWNICTQADEMACGAAGNLVFFAMAPNSFEE